MTFEHRPKRVSQVDIGKPTSNRVDSVGFRAPKRRRRTVTFDQEQQRGVALSQGNKGRLGG